MLIPSCGSSDFCSALGSVIRRSLNRPRNGGTWYSRSSAMTVQGNCSLRNIPAGVSNRTWPEARAPEAALSDPSRCNEVPGAVRQATRALASYGLGAIRQASKRLPHTQDTKRRRRYSTTNKSRREVEGLRSAALPTCGAPGDLGMSPGTVGASALTKNEPLELGRSEPGQEQDLAR